MIRLTRWAVALGCLVFCFCMAIQLVIEGRYVLGQLVWAWFCGILAVILLSIYPAFRRSVVGTRGPNGDIGTVISRFPHVERFLWVSDGFDSGKDQIGRPVNLDGQKGTVVDGTALTIDVQFD